MAQVIRKVESEHWLLIKNHVLAQSTISTLSRIVTDGAQTLLFQCFPISIQLAVPTIRPHGVLAESVFSVCSKFEWIKHASLMLCRWITLMWLRIRILSSFAANRNGCNKRQAFNLDIGPKMLFDTFTFVKQNELECGFLFSICIANKIELFFTEINVREIRPEC